jgi:hypothetical protein
MWVDDGDDGGKDARRDWRPSRLFHTAAWYGVLTLSEPVMKPRAAANLPTYQPPNDPSLKHILVVSRAIRLGVSLLFGNIVQYSAGSYCDIRRLKEQRMSGVHRYVVDMPVRLGAQDISGLYPGERYGLQLQN